MDDGTMIWLLNGDPAVRWQVERDLIGASRAQWERTQSLIGSEGWGSRLLTEQDETGTWGGGLYNPKWISTTYTLLLLRRFGLDQESSSARKGARILLDRAKWVEGGVCYSPSGIAERCINGMVLSIASWFDIDDARIDDIAELMMRARLPDGGWNCRDHQGATHSSMNTTISVLEGLLEWRRLRGTGVAGEAIASGNEFLLEHRMFRSHTTGEVISDAWTKFSFPPRWHYDILRGLDEMRDAGIAPDARATEAIDIVRGRARNGMWPVGPRHPNRVFFRLEDGRSPSRWNTLRALRVLNWWERGSSPSQG
jgi:hypothetical protein